MLDLRIALAARSLPTIRWGRALAGAGVSAAVLLSSLAACSAADPLRPEHELTVPLMELSGLALRHTAAGDELLAVGDEATVIVALPIDDGLPDAARARIIQLPFKAGPGGSDLEGVTVDGDGRVWVLVERGEVRTYELGADGAKEIAVRPIVVPPGHPLEKAWAADANARGEGIAFVDGRLLIAKQKSPAALIEMTIEPDRLVAGAVHPLPDMRDASDLVLHGDTLYVVGSASEKLCALKLPPPRDQALTCTHVWSLPASLGAGRPRWEGLAFLGDGRVVVGVDRKKLDTPNAVVLSAP